MKNGRKSAVKVATKNPKKSVTCSPKPVAKKAKNMGTKEKVLVAVMLVILVVCLVIIGDKAIELKNMGTRANGALISAANSTAPKCGAIAGQSTTWTNKPRTITVKCSACKKTTYTKTFSTTTKTATITITGKNGNTTKCKVNVYVDTTKPTLNLKIAGKDSSGVGYYYTATDNDSGLTTGGKTYSSPGIGIATKDVTITVKDKAGNKTTKTLKVTKTYNNCPSGYKRFVSGTTEKCVKTYAAKLAEICPAGWTKSGTKCTKAPTLTTGKWTKKSSEKMKNSCKNVGVPENSTTSSTKKSSSTVITKTYDKIAYTQNSGFIDKLLGRCWTKTKSQRVDKYTCPSGSTINNTGSTCTRSTLKSYTCPSGGETVGVGTNKSTSCEIIKDRPVKTYSGKIQ